MKKIIEKAIWWLKWERYESLWGFLIGFIVAVLIFMYFKNVWLVLSVFVIVSLVSMILIQLWCVDKYAKGYIEFNKKEKYVNPDELRGQSKKLDMLLDLDKELNDFFNKYSTKTYFEPELNKQWKKRGDYFVSKAQEILSSMSNEELMYGLLGTESIKDIVDFFEYFTPYIPDVKYLKEHPEKAKEYYYENLMQVDAINKKAINEHYFKAIMDLNYFGEIEKYILSLMSNKDLMELANSSKEWYQKLYYYGFIKSESKDK